MPIERPKFFYDDNFDDNLDDNQIFWALIFYNYLFNSLISAINRPYLFPAS